MKDFDFYFPYCSRRIILKYQLGNFITYTCLLIISISKENNVREDVLVFEQGMTLEEAFGGGTPQKSKLMSANSGFLKDPDTGISKNDDSFLLLVERNS